MAIPTKGKSALLGKQCKLMGFAYSLVPQMGVMVNFFFYKIEPDEWVIACGETPSFDPTISRNSLGQMVRGEEIIPYALRHIEGVQSLPVIRKIMEDSFGESHDVKFEWVQK